MGTSASVTGANAGSPLIPSWVEDVDDGSTSEEVGSPEESPSEAEIAESIALAPRARLANARRDLGRFAATGDRPSMQRGVGNYVRRGRGGSSLATQRSAGSARRAGVLGGIVSGSPEYEEVRNRIRDAIQSSGDPQELLAAIAAAASPIDGTLDSETGQRAASQSLQHVLELYPEADPFNLEPVQREALLERFLAIDCFELFYTEVGRHIQRRVALSLAAIRIREIREYFCETFREASRIRRESGSPSLRDLPDQGISAICRNIIADAYITFEAYLDED